MSSARSWINNLDKQSTTHTPTTEQLTPASTLSRRLSTSQLVMLYSFTSASRAFSSLISLCTSTSESHRICTAIPPKSCTASTAHWSTSLKIQLSLYPAVSSRLVWRLPPSRRHLPLRHFSLFYCWWSRCRLQQLTVTVTSWIIYQSTLLLTESCWRYFLHFTDTRCVPR